MTWEQFFQAVGQGNIASVYLMQGPEEHVKHSALQALRKRLLPEGLEALNETVLGAATAQQIIEAAETLPMMCERRLVLVSDWAPLMPGKAKNEAQEAEQIIEWLKNPPASCCTVFVVHGAPDGRKKATSTLAKRAEVVRFELLDDAKLHKWISSMLKTHQMVMDGDAERELVLRAGRALTRLEGELHKLSAYAQGRGRITLADVEQLVAPSPESTVFQMIDQLLLGDQVGAQRLYKSMLEMGESRVGVLFMLTRQLRNMLHLRLMEQQGVKLPEIERRLGLAHFVAGRTQAQARKFSIEGLQRSYQALLDAEFDIKSGKYKDALALDHALLLLGQMR